VALDEQLEEVFGLRDVSYEPVNTLVHDVFAVTTPAGRFALKLYAPRARDAAGVQWELDLLNHLVRNGAPVAKPVPGRHGHLEILRTDNGPRVAVLFKWAPGAKPAPGHRTYFLLGEAAARIHAAADTFSSSLPRERYGSDVLIDEQLQRMKSHLVEAGRWRVAVDLGERVKEATADRALDWGICHMDLTLDNVHRDGDEITVFDLDSAGECWRSIEPHGVLRFSEDYFRSWLAGYRSVRPFSRLDEGAVSAFSVIGDLRVVAWRLGVARSSVGKPLLDASDLSRIVDGWLEMECRPGISGHVPEP
jgi:Ser/Thr protein kinase RdoA (MazF antagonist)